VYYRGDLFAKHREKQCKDEHGHDKKGEIVKERSPFELSDLEHCFFVNHDKTGATCSVYCSHENKLIVVSFRGTCAPIDLLTDASIVQQAWVTGDDVKEQDFPKVHAGFRTSLDSISRRLKELLLATVAPGEEIKNYDMIVTGHSLGGALATLFAADIGQYGIDAGRGLPQLEASDPWWKGIASTFMGQVAQVNDAREPPRPKSLRLYSFGSPRVGNNAFADLFDAITAEGLVDQAYRIVNGEDVVARMPRTVNAFVFGEVRYEHCGPTVLISQPQENEENGMARPATRQTSALWVEGESDDNRCPVRDGIALTSPTAEGSLLGDLVSATKDTFDDVQGSSILNKFTSALEQVSTRLMSLSASDIASVLGIDRNFSEREMKLIQSLMEGKALAHHMEDQYYGGMGRASGFLTLVGQPIVELEENEEVA
jgi:Lipase (class 3)